ncbi:MAG: LLM class F420-dependent oxidoreductase [Dehalococcoidia bacterium]
MMKLGVVFPQTEIGADPAAVRDYAQAVEGADFHHLLVYDHVLGAHPDRFETRRPYYHTSQFHEPFVLFGYLAGQTRRLELVTGVLILPQRQTALVAKQAAAVDVLSGGRLRLGIGVGWNHTEYEALNEDFHTRGRRTAEQIALLRRLWTDELVSFEGRWHTLDRMAIAPLPVQRPIPIWFGGMSEAVLQRLAALGDGWFPQFQPSEESRALLERVRGYIRAAGRDPSAVGIEGEQRRRGRSRQLGKERAGVARTRRPT